jgi:transposase-like protein
MPKALPKQFREDVIRVYKDSDASMAQVANDFGISPIAPRERERWINSILRVGRHLKYAISDVREWLASQRESVPGRAGSGK